MRTTGAVLVMLLLAGCGGEDRAGQGSFQLRELPTSWSDAIDHPFMPLVPGTTRIYRATSSDGVERIEVTVTGRTREVAGVTAVVVHDKVTTEDGEVIEDTFDWFAQDSEGNVWYLGEETTAYEDGSASTEGSWEAGVDGARAGIVMPADPAVGDAYQQEFYAGEAEDRGRVLSLDESVTGPYGSWDGVLMTEDTTPLEPDLVEHKYYAAGIGVVEERDIEGGDEVVVLVEIKGP